MVVYDLPFIAPDPAVSMVCLAVEVKVVLGMIFKCNSTSFHSSSPVECPTEVSHCSAARMHSSSRLSEASASSESIRPVDSLKALKPGSRVKIPIESPTLVIKYGERYSEPRA